MSRPQHAWVAQVLSGPTPEQIRGWGRGEARRRRREATSQRDLCTLIASERVAAAARWQMQIDAIDAIHPKENKT